MLRFAGRVVAEQTRRRTRMEPCPSPPGRVGRQGGRGPGGTFRRAPGAPHGVVRAAGGMGTRPDRTGPGPIVGGRPFQSRGRTRTVPIADHSLVPGGPECRRAASAASVTRWKPPPHASISVR